MSNKEQAINIYKETKRKVKEEILEILESDANINEIYIDGNSLLHLACIINEKALINRILNIGIDINIKNKNGDTPLFTLVAQTEFLEGALTKEEILETLILLLNNGADPNITNHKKNTILHEAVLNCELEIIEHLIDKVININAANNEGITPLHYSVLNLEIPKITLLIEKGADIHAKDNNYNTPLFYSILKDSKYITQNKEVISLLLKSGAKLNATNKTFETIYIVAKNKELNEIVFFLDDILFNKNLPTERLLINAIFNDALDIVKNLCSAQKGLLKIKLDLNDRLISNFSILENNESDHLISLSDLFTDNKALYSPFLIACKLNRADMLEYFISLGEDVNQLDSEYGGLSGLHHALLAEAKDSIKVLLANGADVNIRVRTGHTPLGLYTYITIHKDAAENIQYMIKNNATLINVSNKGDSALISWNSIFKRDALSGTKILVEAGIDINLCDNEGCTALFYACLWGGLENIKYLLEQGANPNIANSKGITPLMQLTGDIIYKSTQKEALELLIKYGANLSARDLKGRTILHYAAKSIRKPEILEILLKHQVNIEAKDNSGLTPLHFAVANENIIAVKELIKQGASNFAKSNNGSSLKEFAEEIGNKKILEMILFPSKVVNP